MATKSGTKKTSAAGKKKAVSDTKRLMKNRMWSTVLFIVGVFLLCVTWIKGEALWSGMQSIMWGLFGVSASLVAPIVIYVGAMLALDKSKSALVSKLVQGLVLIFLVSPMFEIIYCFTTKTDAFSGESFSAVLNALYQNGAVNKLGGGALSIFLGGGLCKLFGDVCALIIIILLIILFVMLLTNITVVDVYKFIAGIVKRIKTSLDESSEVRAMEKLERDEQLRIAEAEEKRKNKDKRIDIAKFIEDDKENTDKLSDSEYKPVKEAKEKKKPERKKELMPADFIEIPDEAVKDKKEDKKEADAPITADIPAAQDEQVDVISTENTDAVNPIYVAKDGQTTLIEIEDSSAFGYQAPPIDLLNPPKLCTDNTDNALEAEKNSETLVETLRSFGVATRIVGVHRGPSVTRYELQPAAGVKVSKITSLADDIALNLAANGVRIEAPIPGKAAVGIELANKTRDTVTIRELIDSDEFRNAGGKLCFPAGRNIEGKIIIGDISKMPHLLIAGTTGSGKSVFTNSIIMSILYNASPEEVKLILIDPKQVEFPVYNGIPHLLIPVVTEAKKAAGALGWAVTEMLKRYKAFADNGVRDLKDYNKLALDSEGQLSPMPQIVIVVDELADLMMAAPKEVEDSICRLAQLARAAGMHLIIATQSPRVDIVTGLIKANIPSRAALKVSNQIDSRVILDEGGAEKLLGNGDLLYKPVGQSKPTRIQGSYVATDEIKRVVDYLKSMATSQYDEEVAEEIEKHIPVPKGEKPSGDSSSEPSGDGDVIERAIEAVVEAGQASTSYLQRKLKLGYARAARIMDELEEMGVVGPADGAKPREVRMTRSELMERKATRSE